ncbi:hypothetical protein BGX31_009117 [Mortierella sp. GBA43]|nr:hypothetical protein BGX31_009117 [Mortierella sp. GBA43]
MTSPASSDDTIRRNADQESLLPGLAYVGAAAIGGAALVNHVRSMPIKILTPLAMATVTGVYFLPAHTEMVKSSWTRTPVARQVSADDEQPMAYTPRGVMEASAYSHTYPSMAVAPPSTMSQGTNSSMMMGPVPQLEQEGKEQAKSWLDPWRVDSEKTAGAQMKFPDTSMNQSIPENPSSSRWSWWTRSEQMTPKGEKNTKVQMRSKEPASSMSLPMTSSMTSERVERPLSTTTTVTTTTTMDADPSTSAAAQESAQSQEELQMQQQQQRRGSLKPRKIVVDKAIASAAIKGHDDLINRDSLMGKNTEETARKVHDNVIDAAVPKHRQSRHETHPIELSRRASQSDKMDGRFVVRESQDPNVPPERVLRRGSKSNLHHGTENQDRRSSMMFKGVENIEHSINKRIEKALQEEADFWHQESMKEQSNARGGERGM